MSTGKKNKDIKILWRSHGVSILAALLLLIVAYNTLTVAGMSRALGQKIDEAAESSRPSKIKIVSLTDGSCSTCFDMRATISSLKGANVEVESEQSLQYSSAEGLALVQRYGMTRIPALLVTGEIDRDQGFESEMELRDDALVFEAPKPPYTDAGTGQQKGLVKVTLLENQECVKCISLRGFVSQLRQNGVTVASQQVLDYSDEAAQELIVRYDVQRLPTLILSRDITEYAEIADAFSSSFLVHGDGSFVSMQVNPPYYDIGLESITGLVELTMLTDESCVACYDVEIHKPILANLGLVIGEERTIDISTLEGEGLLSKYGITKVPTILLSSDAQEYGSLRSVWSQVGTTANDGSLLFTNTDIVGVYRDLSTGEVVGS